MIIFGSPAYPVYRHGGLFAHGQLHEVAPTPERGYRLELDQIARDPPTHDWCG